MSQNQAKKGNSLVDGVSPTKIKLENHLKSATLESDSLVIKPLNDFFENFIPNNDRKG